MDCSPPGSSDHEILQARILEWVAISFSYYIRIYYIFIYLSVIRMADELNEAQLQPVFVSLNKWLGLDHRGFFQNMRRILLLFLRQMRNS